MAKKKAEQLLAQELYLTTDKTLKDIADIVGVSQVTIGSWAKTGQWEILKTAKKITKASLIVNYYESIKNLQEIIAERPKPENVPTSKEADVLAKLTVQIERLEKTNSLSDYIEIFESFLKWLMPVQPALAKNIAMYLYEFCELKASELNNG